MKSAALPPLTHITDVRITGMVNQENARGSAPLASPRGRLGGLSPARLALAFQHEVMR